MDLFEKATSTKKQGGIGEARAIYEYTNLGYSVWIPVSDNNKFDLIIEKDGVCLRVQVKTSSCLEHNANPNSYSVTIDSRTGARGHYRPREDGDYDILFAMVKDGRCWSIPVEALGETRTKITVGNTKYNEYLLDT